MSNGIIDKIKNENIKMKPKWEFALKSALLVALSLVSLVLLLFLVSFIFRFGLFISLSVFPWMVIVVILGFVILLEVLITRYALVYRKPVIYSVVAIICGVFILGIILNIVHFHEALERGNVPMIRRMYDRPMIRPIIHPIIREYEFRFEINNMERL
jgi:hypothetical protein